MRLVPASVRAAIMNNADERYRIRPSVSWCDIPDAHMACSKLGRFVAARNRICQAGLDYLIKGSIERRRGENVLYRIIFSKG